MEGQVRPFLDENSPRPKRLEIQHDAWVPQLMGRRPWGYGPGMPFGPPQMGFERQAQIEERLDRIEASLREILENQRRILSGD